MQPETENLRLNSEDEDSNQDLVQKSTVAAFGGLYVLNQQADLNRLFVYLGFLIEFLQLISFTMDGALVTKFPWHDGTVGWLSTISTAIRLYPLAGTNGAGVHSMFFAAVFLFIAGLVAFAAVSVDFLIHGRAAYPALGASTRLYLTFICGPLFVPIVGSFASNFWCTSDLTNVVCGSTSNTIGAILSAVLLLCYLAFAFTIVATVYPRLPTSGSLLARPTARDDLWVLLVKTVLTVAFVFGRHASGSTAWVLVILDVVCLLLLAYNFTTHLPFYTWETNLIQCCVSWLLSWASIALVLVSLTNTPKEPGLSLLFFILSPLLVLACSLQMQSTRNELLKMEQSQISTVVECELKVRFQMANVTSERRLAVTQNIDLNLDAEKRAQHALVISEGDELLAYGGKRFPFASMLLVRTHFNFAYSDNHSLGLNLLARAQQRSPALDEQFTIFFYRKMNEESFTSSETNAEVLAYMKFQHTLNEARKQDELSSRFQTMFWNELLQPQTDVGRLSDMAEQLNTAMIDAQESFRSLLKQNANSTQVLRMYASFLIDIANEIPQGNKYLERADELEEQRSRSHERGESSDALFDDRNALVNISGELANVGEIVNVNMGTVRLFGYSRNDLIGRNIDALMPPPFSNNHQGFLMNYLETGKATIMGRNRLVFGMHRAGHLLPIDIFVREIASAAGMTFMAVLRSPGKGEQAAAVPLIIAMEEQRKQDAASSVAVDVEALKRLEQKVKYHNSGDQYHAVHYAITDSVGRVSSCTIGCSSLFGSAMEEVRSGMIDLVKWLPSCNQADVLQRMRSQEGYKVNVSRVVGRGQPTPVCIHQAVFAVGQDECYLTSFAEMKSPIKSELPSSSTTAGEAKIDIEDDEDSDGSMGLDDVDSNEAASSDEEEDEDDDEEVAISKPLKSALKTQKAAVAAAASSTIRGDSSSGSGSGKESAVPGRPSSKQPAGMIVSASAQAAAAGAQAPVIKSVLKRDHPTSEQARPQAQFRKATSVSSKSSGSSKMSSNQLQMKLRSFASLRSSRDLSEGIRVLRVTLVSVLLFVIGISLARFFTMTTLINRFILVLDTLFQSGTRRFLCIRLTLSAQTLLYGPLTDANGVTWKNFWTMEEVEPYRKIMADDALMFESINKVLYIDRNDQLSTYHASLYNDRVVKTFHVRDNTKYFDLFVSLWDASQMMISQSRIYKDMFILDIIDTDPTCYYVLRNGVARGVMETLTVLNETCFLYQQDTIGSLATMRNWSLVFLLSGIFMIVLVTMVIVRPKILIVEANKENVLLLFADIPMSLITVFHQRAQKRLSTIRAAMNGEGAVEENAEDMDEELNATEAAFKAQADAEMAATNKDKERDEADADADANEDDHEEAQEMLNVESGVSRQQSLVEQKKIDRQKRRLQSQRQRIHANQSFILRHLTMLKVCVVVVVTIIYFSVSYQLEYAGLQQRLAVSPNQVNWSQHRRLSLLLMVYDLRQYLTQRFWKVAEAGAPGILDVTEPLIFSDLQMLIDIENGLAFGSSRFGVDPPVDRNQVELTFENMCVSVKTVNCTTYADGILKHGMHAGMLEFSNQARKSFAIINSTLQHPLSNKLVDSNSTVNVTAALEYLDILNNIFHMPSMNYLMDMTDIHLGSGLETSGRMYQDGVAKYLDSESAARWVTLVVFILICFFMYVFFYNPMCWQLDAEQKRTSSMLLMIPNEIMERIPTIREFIQKLEG